MHISYTTHMSHTHTHFIYNRREQMCTEVKPSGIHWHTADGHRRHICYADEVHYICHIIKAIKYSMQDEKNKIHILHKIGSTDYVQNWYGVSLCATTVFLLVAGLEFIYFMKRDVCCSWRRERAACRVCGLNKFINKYLQLNIKIVELVLMLPLEKYRIRPGQ